MTMALHENRFLTNVNDNLSHLSSASSTNGFLRPTTQNNQSSLPSQQTATSANLNSVVGSSYSSSGDGTSFIDESLPPSYSSQFPPLRQNGFHSAATGSPDVGTPRSNEADFITSNGFYSALVSNISSANALNGTSHSTSPLGSSGHLNSLANNESHVSYGLKPTIQLFAIPYDERMYDDSRSNVQRDVCKHVGDDFGVTVDLNVLKDRSLSIVVEGSPDAVLKARRSLFSQLQKQVVGKSKISREFYGAILGKGAQRLRQLEIETATKINVPSQNSNDDIISITGPREGIDKAKHQLDLIVAQEAKKGYERIKVPKKLHPFVCGPYNRQVEEWAERLGCKVHVPPASLNNDEIVLVGDKDGVLTCQTELFALINRLEQQMTKVEVTIDKAKHKYIIGPKGKGIQEILEANNVSVEVPPLDSVSTSITLRGSSANLGQAVNTVYVKADSYKLAQLPAPNWLHKYLIGKSGSKIQALTEGHLSKVHVEFTDDWISIDGPREEMEAVYTKLAKEIEELESSLTFCELKCDVKFHKHIIGKNGSGIDRLVRNKDVRINFPRDVNDMSSSSGDASVNMIRLEGNKQDMEEVAKELRSLIHRVENEKSEDIKIEQRFHRQIIGTKGESIGKFRKQYPDVSINFPDLSKVKKSDFVNIRGPKDQVEQCCKALQKMAKELAENNYEVQVSVQRKFHKNIIGKDGSTINQIRKDTNTRIEMPPPQAAATGGFRPVSIDSDANAIRIIGRKENVEKARKKILEIENQLANITERTIDIPFKQHKALIGKSGAHIKSIVSDCGDVTVHFPQDGASNKVVIRGERKHVEMAVDRLNEAATKMGEATEDIEVKQELYRMLIGRDGSNVRALQEEYGCTIVFDNNAQIITVFGSKDGIKKTKQTILDRVKQLENTVESTVEVEPTYHKHFMQNSRRILTQLINECGGIQISFPPINQPSSVVKIKGPTEFVEMAKERILQIVDDVQNQTAKYADIPQHHHRTVLGRKGVHVQQIETDFHVRVKFLDMRDSPNESPVHSGAAGPGNLIPVGVKLPPQQPHQVLVVGRAENVDKAIQQLYSLVPIEKKIVIACEFHRSLIGQAGKNLRELQNKHNVRIMFPPLLRQQEGLLGRAPGETDEGELVSISGSPSNVSSAEDELNVQVGNLIKDKEDHIAKSYETKIIVDPKFHNKIIGVKGATINKMKDRHGVIIRFPARNSPADDPILIIGYKEATEKCRDEIQAMVDDLSDHVTVELDIDTRVHPRLIGTRGKNLKKLKDDYNVDIKFPAMNSSEPNKVVLTGKPDAVDECRDQLLTQTEEYMLDITDNEWAQKYIRNRDDDRTNRQPTESTGFVVRDAPWDSSDFPALSNESSTSTTPAWFQR